MIQRHTDQISPKMLTDFKISRNGAWQNMCFEFHQAQSIWNAAQGTWQTLGFPLLLSFIPLISQLRTLQLKERVKGPERVSKAFLLHSCGARMGSSNWLWNICLHPCYFMPLALPFIIFFFRFAPSAPSPHHISPRRVPAPSSILQRTQPPHTQQPSGPHLKSYQPETNSSFQPNGIHVHGEQRTGNSLGFKKWNCWVNQVSSLWPDSSDVLLDIPHNLLEFSFKCSHFINVLS